MERINLYQLVKRAYHERRRLVAPLVGFPGVNLVDTSIKLAQQNYGEHYKVIEAIVQRYHPDIIFPLMDLSVEANATGRYTIFPVNDSATVVHHDFSYDEIKAMRRIDYQKDTRIFGYVKTLRLMNENLPADVVRGAYVIGPYSLAGLILGANQAALATILEKERFHQLVGFAADLINQYANFFIDVGAQLVCILEPSGVMLGPAQFREFSGNYIRKIVKQWHQRGVPAVLHVCGNSMHLIDEMVASEVDGLSLDAPEIGVDLVKVAQKIPETVVIIGNISPVRTIMTGSPEQVATEVQDLLLKMNPYPNFVLSTGCDLPQGVPLENIDAFVRAGREFVVEYQQR
jgi:uroporphyrinogen decarboxylase